VKNSMTSSLDRSLRTPLIIATLAALVFFGGFWGWAVTVPIASAALASGSIIPEGYRRTVQHLEGGIIRKIQVKEGDYVKAGQSLIVLKGVQALAVYRAHESRLLGLRAVDARLLAEASGALKPDWSTIPMLPDRDRAINDQMAVFKSGLETISSRKNILKQTIAQHESKIVGLVEQVVSAGHQLKLMDPQIKDLNGLVKNRIASKTRLLELKRERLEIAKVRMVSKSEIARVKQAIGEAKSRIIDLDINRKNEATRLLSDVRLKIADLKERMVESRSVLKRTSIVAPVSGTVINLKFKTADGVIKSGEEIMDIVPEDEELVVDVRVNPADIDVVSKGLTAQVMLSAYQQRNLPKLDGRVRHVSADRMTDAKTGENYYLARIEIPPAALENLNSSIELTAGMPADVMIFTGKQTMFDYLIGPLLISVNKSFRED